MTKMVACSIVTAAASPVDLDITVVLQVAVFFLVLVALTLLLYRPVMALFDARVARTEGLREEARARAAQAEAILARYEARMQEFRKEAAETTRQLRQEMHAQEEEILTRAKIDSAAMLAESRSQLEKAGASIRRELEGSVEEMAERLARTLREGGTTP